ncbi:MAG: UDP-3-O-[3-hydroxymyristoyl] N-acetylglucosamine deacetylase [Elusimicrobia bacterium RIFOXYB2_FULL_62_6]|nr:MAG: UDP-3-O-[3-hydroxymyristoyl] N-acetylglucosamine deacetylase [Elusimicrobia bacterium RIFOXYB2_FULL_62_6]
MHRKTIKNKAALEGIGLHKGGPAKVFFLPAPGPTGVRFLKPDLTSPVQASLASVAGTARGTSISGGGRTIYTVEHILSACAGLGIDDLDVALEGEEPPAADGSALPFAAALKQAGAAEKPGQEKEFLKLGAPVEFRSGEALYRAAPSGAPSFKITFSHPHKLVGTQVFEIVLTPENYLSEIAPARTFGFKYEIEQLRAAGLGLGGSLENAVIIDDDAILSAEGRLRFPDEFVRHKLLDLLGDLKLTGLDLGAVSVEAVFTGHKANVNFAKLLLERHAVN